MTTTLVVIRKPAITESFTVQELNDIVRHGMHVDAIRPTHINQRRNYRIPLWKLMPHLEATITPDEISRSIRPRTLLDAPQAYLRFAHLLNRAKTLGGCAVRQ
jgi:hypothetical protein